MSAQWSGYGHGKCGDCGAGCDETRYPFLQSLCARCFAKYLATFQPLPANSKGQAKPPALAPAVVMQ
jgi:hypothetical protein